MKIFLKHCKQKNNITRAIKVSFLVGTILAVINHYDMFTANNFELRRIVQIILTYVIPFSVSLYSAAMQGRHNELKLKD